MPKGQLRRFIALQKTGWNSLDEGVRRVAASVLWGVVPNIAGLATDFADTGVYWRDRHPRDKGPTRTQWLEFTKAFAAQKKLIWASDTAPYDQYHRNVLFIQAKFRDETPPVIVPSQASQPATTQPELETSYADTHHARGARDAFEYEDESGAFQASGSTHRSTCSSALRSRRLVVTPGLQESRSSSMVGPCGGSSMAVR